VSFLLQLAVYLFVQSYVFSVVHSRFVQIQQSAPQSATSHDVATDFLDENELDELHETSLSKSLQDEAKNGNNLKSVGLRFKRRSSPCVLGKTIRWNDCLGRYFIELHCRSQSVVCLSANNVPPKCKKNYGSVLGQKGYCRILNSCTCAAWLRSTARSGTLTVFNVSSVNHRFVMFVFLWGHCSCNILNVNGKMILFAFSLNPLSWVSLIMITGDNGPFRRCGGHFEFSCLK